MAAPTTAEAGALFGVYAEMHVARTRPLTDATELYGQDPTSPAWVEALDTLAVDLAGQSGLGNTAAIRARAVQLGALAAAWVETIDTGA